MTTKNKLIKLYKDSLKSGKLLGYGLCIVLEELNLSEENLRLFRPTNNDMCQLQIDRLSTGFWGSDLGFTDNDRFRKFSTLRQTILAFLIAMEE